MCDESHDMFMLFEKREKREKEEGHVSKLLHTMMETVGKIRRQSILK